MTNGKNISIVNETATKKKIKGKLLNKEGYCNFETFMTPDIDLYFVLGHRWDGKTYGAMNLMLNEYYKTATPSVYVRRLDSSIEKTELSTALDELSDTLPTYHDGVFNAFDYRSKRFYPVRYDSGKIVARGKPIIYAAALNTWQTSKGADRGQIRYLVLDEAIDERAYLKNEIKAWKNTMSTYLRHYGKTTVIILANPLNPYCPYFDHYGIHIEELEQDSITDIQYDDGQVMRFVWLPESRNQKRKGVNALLNAGSTTHSITKGKWDVGQYRCYEPSVLDACEFLYNFEVVFNRQNYLVSCYYGDNINLDVEMTLTGIFYTFTNISKSIADYTEVHTEIAITDRTVPIATQPEEKFDHFHSCNITDDLIQAFRDCRTYYDDNVTGAAIDQWLKTVVTKRGGLRP